MIVNIRIRDDLYNTLREKAKRNYRTITAELEIILSNALAGDTTTPVAEVETTTPVKQVKKSIIGDEEEYYREYGNKGEEILGWQ